MLGEALTFLGLLLTGRSRHFRRIVGYSVLEGAPTLCSGLLVSAAVDRGFLAGRPLTGLAWLGALGAVWVVAAVGTRQVYPWLAGTVEPLRDALLSRLVSASLRSAVLRDDPSHGPSVTQATVQVETARALFASLLRTMRQLVTAGLAALTGLSLLSATVAVGVAACVGAATVLFVVLLQVLIRRHRTAVLAEEAITARAAPIVTGVRDVVAAGAEEYACRQTDPVIDDAAEAARAVARARAWRLPIVTLGAHVPLLALLGATPWLLAGHRLTVGDVVGAVVYLTTGLEPAVQLMVNAAGTVIVNLGVVLARLSEACTPPPPTVVVSGRGSPQGYGIELDAVTFRYARLSAPVIRGLSLHIPEGGHLAVVGPSGAGKSTLTQVLTGLISPQQGSVRLGGVPLTQLDPDRLRQMVALIPQEAYVFAGSVRENLAYLRPDVTDREIRVALEALGVADLVTRLGDLDGTIDPDDGILSPGTCQLIAATRVYLSAARVVILDEATCHLEPEAEARIETAFAHRDGTLVVIAHRISSALRAQRILVMGGADTGLGRHEDLLAANALYAELVGYWSAHTVAAT